MTVPDGLREALMFKSNRRSSIRSTCQTRWWYAPSGRAGFDVQVETPAFEVGLAVALPVDLNVVRDAGTSSSRRPFAGSAADSLP